MLILLSKLRYRRIRSFFEKSLKIKAPANLEVYMSNDINNDILIFAQDINEKRDMIISDDKPTVMSCSLFSYKNRNKAVIILNANKDASIPAKAFMHECIHSIHFKNYMNTKHHDIDSYYIDDNWLSFITYSEFHASSIGDRLAIEFINEINPINIQDAYKYCYEEHVNRIIGCIESRDFGIYSCASYLGGVYNMRNIFNDKYGKLYPILPDVKAYYPYADELYNFLAITDKFACTLNDIQHINKINKCCNVKKFIV